MYVRHRLAMLIEIDPTEAKRQILDAYRKAKCSRRDAAKLLGVHEATFGTWFNKLGLQAQLEAMREEADREGWLHTKNRMGGRPPSDPTPSKKPLPKKRAKKKAA